MSPCLFPEAGWSNGVSKVRRGYSGVCRPLPPPSPSFVAHSGIQVEECGCGGSAGPMVGLPKEGKGIGGTPGRKSQQMALSEGSSVINGAPEQAPPKNQQHTELGWARVRTRHFPPVTSSPSHPTGPLWSPSTNGVRPRWGRKEDVLEPNPHPSPLPATQRIKVCPALGDGKRGNLIQI